MRVARIKARRTVCMDATPARKSLIGQRAATRRGETPVVSSVCQRGTPSPCGCYSSSPWSRCWWPSWRFPWATEAAQPAARIRRSSSASSHPRSASRQSSNDGTNVGPATERLGVARRSGESGISRLRSSLGDRSFSASRVRIAIASAGGRPHNLFWRLQPPVVAAGRYSLREGLQGASRVSTGLLPMW
jgi:hypothetical protein